MNFFHHFRDEILKALEGLVQAGELPAGLDFEAVTTEPPRDPSHGDLATNAALVLSKVARKNPQELARLIVDKLQSLESVETVSVAGPGFINIKLVPTFWYHQLTTILEKGEGYGASTLGLGQKINLEYVSANPTGPIHAGHGRVAVVADVLATLLEKVGYMLIVGDKEVESKTVTERARSGKPDGPFPIETFIGNIRKEIDEKIIN